MAGAGTVSADLRPVFSGEALRDDAGRLSSDHVFRGLGGAPDIAFDVVLGDLPGCSGGADTLFDDARL